MSNINIHHTHRLIEINISPITMCKCGDWRNGEA